MAKNVVFGLLMLSASALISGPALAADPTLHQVYQAADAGRLNDAQTMMQQVLQAHPNSGKAHYVEAELLVKQGQLKQADSELSTAEQLAPGLPFAQPQSVHKLKMLLGESHATLPAGLQSFQAGRNPATASFPWGMLLTGIALVAFILWAVGFMKQRNAGMANGGYGAVNPNTPYSMPPQTYGAGGFGGAGQGLGSRVMGGLATGAAVGAGVVAGEALMHHFMDGNQTNNAGNGLLDLGPSDSDSYANDLGGNDFGVTDSGSWDDSSDSSSDWN